MSASPPTSNVCRACGAAVVPDAPLGHCPRCLAKLGLLGLKEDPSSEPEVPGLIFSGSNRFGDYTLLRQIGRGGMGVVYEARHLQLHRSVALKVILDSELASPVARRRFRIEAEAAARLDHPHIIPIYEVGECEGQPFISMKLVQGRSLSAHIKNGDLCSAQALNQRGSHAWLECQNKVAQLVAKVARAVQHAHQNGVLHRDLKPSNILLDEQRHPFLTDFGLAKLVEEHPRDEGTPSPTISGTVLGTPGYMSPEQAAGGKVSPATDVYSVGAILYELLTGRPPFHANTPLETMRLVLDHQPRRPRLENPQVHADLETICLKCLEKNAGSRYASAEDLAEDLERWLRREPIKARAAGPLLRVQRWIRRNPLGTTLIVSLGLGLSVALFLLNLAKEKQRESDHRRDVLIAAERQKIENEWGDTNKQMIRISSEVLSVIGNYREPLGRPEGGRRLTFAVNTIEQPVELAKGYVPFLKWLERDLTSRLNRSVRLDLVICREFSPQYLFVAYGQTDVQRMGALPYVLAYNVNPDIQPLVREDIGKRAVIYVRRDLYEQGVITLPNLANHSFAFGERDSTISLMARVYLARAGVQGSDLSDFKIFTQFEPESLQQFEEIRAGAFSSGADRAGELPVFHSHKEGLFAVLKKKFDAGVARSSYLEKHADQLRVLLDYEVPADVYVASAKLEPELVRALRESLLNLDDKELLSNLPLQPLQQFCATSDAEYETLRQACTNEALQFDFSPTAPAE